MSFLFIIALFLSVWSIFIVNQNQRNTIEHDMHHPDAFMENVNATIMNKEGLPALKVTTPKLVHYLENDTTNIYKPDVIIYRQSPQPWHINSEYAEAIQGTAKVIFWNNVIIKHLADTANPFTTMQTYALEVFPDKQIAETNQGVTIQQPDTTVHATGMIANLNNGTVKLLSNAQGEYVPTKN